MRFGIFFLVILLSISLCTPAYIHGTIYKGNFEQVDKTIIQVEGAFSYRMITEKSNYSIFLPAGEYKLSGQSNDLNGNPILYSEEIIRVGTEDQQVDIVLKPVGFDFIILIPIFLVILIIIGWFAIGQTKKPEPVPHLETKKTELDKDTKSVIDALNSLEGRCTQKDLKEMTKFSDAKLSLILTELEHMNRIKKFKKGRGNIIKLI